MIYLTQYVLTQTRPNGKAREAYHLAFSDRPPALGDTVEHHGKAFQVALIGNFHPSTQQNLGIEAVFIALCSDGSQMPLGDSFSIPLPYLYVPVLLPCKIATCEDGESYTAVAMTANDLPKKGDRVPDVKGWIVHKTSLFLPLDNFSAQLYAGVAVLWSRPQDQSEETVDLAFAGAVC